MAPSELTEQITRLRADGTAESAAKASKLEREAERASSPKRAKSSDSGAKGKSTKGK